MGETPSRQEVPLRGLIRAASAVVAAAGVAALLGWMSGKPYLASLSATAIPMAPSTAVLFVLYAFALVARTLDAGRRWTYQLGAGTVAGNGLAAVVLLVFSMRGIHPSMEHLGLWLPHTPGQAPLGHMSPVTALCFIAGSLAYLASLPKRASLRWLLVSGSWLAGLLTAGAFVLFLAYLYGDPLFYVGAFIPPALTTSVAFMVLGIALLALTVPRAWPWDDHSADSRGMSLALVSLFLLFAAGIVAVGRLHAQNIERQHRSEIERQLSAIAELKIDELVQWRQQRISDGSMYARNPAFYVRASQFFQDPGGTLARDELTGWMLQTKSAYAYDRVSLLDVDGVERLSAAGDTEPVPGTIARLAASVMESKQVRFHDLYEDERNQRVYLSVLVPILPEDESAGALGTLVLRIDPTTYLFPMLNRWPIPSASAETLTRISHRRNC